MEKHSLSVYTLTKFGLTFVPKISTHNILAELRGVLNYLDDLFVYGSSPDEHKHNSSQATQALGIDSELR